MKAKPGVDIMIYVPQVAVYAKQFRAYKKALEAGKIAEFHDHSEGAKCNPNCEWMEDLY